MAGATAIKEGTIVGILVTALTDCTQASKIFCRRSFDGLVALDAFHRCMFPCEAETCLGVIEAGRRLPVVHRVTPAAVGTQRIPVRIGVTGVAAGIEPHVGPSQILNSDADTSVLADEPGLVALAAIQLGVGALKHVARFLVIELARIPACEHVGAAEVFEMAGCAGMLFGLSLHRHRVIPPSDLQSQANFAMAFIALEGRLTGAEHVTRRASQRAVECGMRLGERAR